MPDAVSVRGYIDLGTGGYKLEKEAWLSDPDDAQVLAAE